MKFFHFLFLITLISILLFSCTNTPKYKPTLESDTEYVIIYEDEEE
jgi:hypothetical protein